MLERARRQRDDGLRVGDRGVIEGQRKPAPCRSHLRCWRADWL